MNEQQIVKEDSSLEKFYDKELFENNESFLERHQAIISFFLGFIVFGIIFWNLFWWGMIIGSKSAMKEKVLSPIPTTEMIK